MRLRASFAGRGAGPAVAFRGLAVARVNEGRVAQLPGIIRVTAVSTGAEGGRARLVLGAGFPRITARLCRGLNEHQGAEIPVTHNGRVGISVSSALLGKELA